MYPNWSQFYLLIIILQLCIADILHLMLSSLRVFIPKHFEFPVSKRSSIYSLYKYLSSTSSVQGTVLGKLLILNGLLPFVPELTEKNFKYGFIVKDLKWY